MTGREITRISFNLALEAREGYYLMIDPPDFGRFVVAFERLFLPVER